MGSFKRLYPATHGFLCIILRQRYGQPSDINPDNSPIVPSSNGLPDFDGPILKFFKLPEKSDGSVVVGMPITVLYAFQHE